MRLDAYLKSIYPEHTRSYFARLIEEGLVLVDGKPALSKSRDISGSESVEVSFPEPESFAAQPEDIPLDIVYEDEDVIVVNKPSGMVVHPAAGNPGGTLVNAVMHHAGESLSGINGELRPGIVHRIDKDTSGLLMVAKNDFAHNALAEQLSRHDITRAYLALVYGAFAENEGRVDNPIGRDPKDRKRMTVLYKGRRPDGEGAVPTGYRSAATRFRVLESFPSRAGGGQSFSLLECRLETGRTHQIRVHMASLGHPVLGDPVYGPKKQPGAILGRDYEEGQLLHAYLLGFKHPRTGEYLEFRAELPEKFERVLAKLRAR